MDLTLLMVTVLCLLALAESHSKFNILENSPKGSWDSANDEVIDLPGLNDKVNFKHYSGYLKADNHNKTGKYHHYWFAESQSNPSEDPVLLWLNGGPGCSSLLGMFTELGPFDITKEDGREISLNPYSWNKVANMLFLESPVGVGFSYAVNHETKTDDDITAKENYYALKSFFRKFPQFKRNKFFMSGESYAGVYLPTLAVLVDDDKEINFGGVAIGNGYLDAGKLAMSLVFFSYNHGLIGRKVWKDIANYCCDGTFPTPPTCHFMDPHRSEKCSKAMADATISIVDQKGLNAYNIYDVCLKSEEKISPDVMLTYENAARTSRTLDYGTTTRTGLREAARNLMMRSLNLTHGAQSQLVLKDKAEPVLEELNFDGNIGGPTAHCPSQEGLGVYLSRRDVQKAIHVHDISNPVRWTPCVSLEYKMLYPIKEGGLAPQMQKLLHSSRKLKLLVYNGDVDMVCNFLGDEWFVEGLKRKVIKTYRPWSIDGLISGYLKIYDGITFMTIKGSGHMVPGDKPRESLAFIKAFLDGRLNN